MLIIPSDAGMVMVYVKITLKILIVSSYSRILFYLVVGFAVYFGVGFYINQKKHGLNGAEALPHSKFW